MTELSQQRGSIAAQLTSSSNGKRKGEVGGPFLTCANLERFESLKTYITYHSGLSAVFGNTFNSNYLCHISDVSLRKSNHHLC